MTFGLKSFRRFETFERIIVPYLTSQADGFFPWNRFEQIAFHIFKIYYLSSL